MKNFKKHPYIYSFLILALIFALLLSVTSARSSENHRAQLLHLIGELEKEGRPVKYGDIVENRRDADTAKDNGTVYYKNAQAMVSRRNYSLIQDFMKDPYRLSNWKIGDGKSLELPEELERNSEHFDEISEQIKKGNAAQQYRGEIKPTPYLPYRGLYMKSGDFSAKNILYRYYLLKIYRLADAKQYGAAYDAYTECLSYIRRSFINENYRDGRIPTSDLLAEINYLDALHDILRQLMEVHPVCPENLEYEIGEILKLHHNGALRALETDLALLLSAYDSYNVYLRQTPLGNIQTAYLAESSSSLQNAKELEEIKNLKSETLPDSCRDRIKNLNIRQFQLNEKYLKSKSETDRTAMENFADTLTVPEKDFLGIPPADYSEKIEASEKKWRSLLTDLTKLRPQTAKS